MSLRATDVSVRREGVSRLSFTPVFALGAVSLAFAGGVVANAQSPCASAVAGPSEPSQKPAASLETLPAFTLTPAQNVVMEDIPLENASAEPPAEFTATAYSLKGRTASGDHVRRGVIAADPRVLPLGSVVKLHAGPYSGVYHVKDTGGRIRGRRIDIYMPSYVEAKNFGRRTIRLEVLRRHRVAPSQSPFQSVKAMKRHHR
jgi:3D (Asp-Asp-Asp) domain-containing protein